MKQLKISAVLVGGIATQQPVDFVKQLRVGNRMRILKATELRVQNLITLERYDEAADRLEDLLNNVKAWAEYQK